MTWYEEYDFISNPFTIKPQEGYEDFFGQKKVVNSVNKAMDKGEIAVVFGKYGCGKTTILKGIIDKFKGARKVAYYNAYTSEKAVNFEDILVLGGSRLSSFFGVKSKNMILLLDEAHNLMKRDIDDLIDYYEDGYFKSIVLVTSHVDHKFPKDLMEVVGNNAFRLEMFGEKEAISFCKERLEGVDLLKNEAIKKIYKSAKSPRDFIMRCEDACRSAVERGSKSVEDEDLAMA